MVAFIILFHWLCKCSGFQNKTVHFSLKIYSLQCDPVLWWYSDLKEEGKTCGKSNILRHPRDSHECVYTQRELLQIEWAHNFTSYILKKDPDEVTRSYTKESQPKRTSLTMGPAFMNQKLLKFWKTDINSHTEAQPEQRLRGFSVGAGATLFPDWALGRPQLWSFPRDRGEHYGEWLETGTALSYAEEWCGLQADTLLRSQTKHLGRTGADTHGHRHQICSHPLK